MQLSLRNYDLDNFYRDICCFSFVVTVDPWGLAIADKSYQKNREKDSGTNLRCFRFFVGVMVGRIVVFGGTGVDGRFFTDEGEILGVIS